MPSFSEDIEKYERLKKNYEDPTFEVVSGVFRALANKKIIGAGSFLRCVTFVIINQRIRVMTTLIAVMVILVSRPISKPFKATSSFWKNIFSSSQNNQHSLNYPMCIKLSFPVSEPALPHGHLTSRSSPKADQNILSHRLTKRNMSQRRPT